MYSIKIAQYERGLLFRDRDFVGVLRPGRYKYFDPFFKLEVEVYDTSEPALESYRLDVIVASGALENEAVVVDLADGERALVWIDSRLQAVLVPGLYAFWNSMKRVDVERIDARQVRFDSPKLAEVLALPRAASLLELVDVEAETVGLFYVNGVFQETLGPGRYAFWKGEGLVQVRHVDSREQVLDVVGQDIMTADKVTLRLNALLTYRVTEPRASVAAVSDYVQSIYREAQLALRAVVGTKTLDTLLEERDAVADELRGLVAPRLEAIGLELVNLGIRDVILPGDMKVLLNKVIEAQKAAEANLITRREETAAIRSQLNAARILESNPTLMRLRELEALERVTEKANLTVVLGDGGLADKVVKLL